MGFVVPYSVVFLVKRFYRTGLDDSTAELVITVGTVQKIKTDELGIEQKLHILYSFQQYISIMKVD